jgi:hypothetical protein
MLRGKIDMLLGGIVQRIVTMVRWIHSNLKAIVKRRDTRTEPTCIAKARLAHRSLSSHQDVVVVVVVTAVTVLAD